jgi:hypothetical protein
MIKIVCDHYQRVALRWFGKVWYYILIRAICRSWMSEAAEHSMRGAIVLPADGGP